MNALTFVLVLGAIATGQITVRVRVVPHGHCHTVCPPQVSQTCVDPSCTVKHTTINY